MIEKPLGNGIIIFQAVVSMHKSSPLIEEPHATKIIRSSKRSNTQRNSNDYENHPVPIPFLQNTDFLPPTLLQQISQLNYITPGQLQTLTFNQAPSCLRRSSLFARQIQAMQKAAQDQELKMGNREGKKVCFQEPMTEQEEMGGISLDEECNEDMFSRGERQRWALQPLEMQDEQSAELGTWGERPLQFYSMTDLGVAESPVDEYFDI